ncbi:MAG TPA: ROK family transcriptional regulator [Acidimicrobiales bacterium]|nr:ROK family transcriptional regulator [Acidimicrobiales bacterium]
MTKGGPGGHEPFGRRGQTTRRAVPGDARRHNRALVLRTLFRDGPLSRADLARSTHVTRVTASDLVAELIESGLVEELGTRPEQGVGKPATLVGIVADARFVLSLDLSDDEQFRGALVDLSGKVVDRAFAARDGRTGPAALELVDRIARELAQRAERPLLGVGVGSPGVVDLDGVVLEAPNLDWFGVDLAGRLAAALDGAPPTHVANDANAAVLGELSLNGPEGRSLLLVKIGHGVGAGLVVDGHLVVGERFAAGEIGHVVVDPRGDPCACGRRGCLETAVAAPLLRRRLVGAGGDGAAQARARRAAGSKLGSALAPVVSALNLREVVLSGPLDVLDETFRRAALRAIQSRTMPAVGDNVDIRLTALGEDDVLLGAAMLVLDRELGVA